MTEQSGSRPFGSATLRVPIAKPGSEAAKTAGCICPVLDNNHGRFAPYPPDGWWITEGCPLHDQGNSRS